MNNIFEFLDWVLKKKGKEPIDEGNIYPYMFNRWLSMADPDIAQIVNLTYNRWLSDYTDLEFLSLAKFYKQLLPKHLKKISYIKKDISEKEEIDESEKQTNELICMNMEISNREKKILDDMVKFLNE